MEVCRNQQWGRVCDDSWDVNDSAYVCRRLGLSKEGISIMFIWYACSMSIKIILSGAEAIITVNMQSTPDLFGPSTLSFFALDDVGCNGSESNLP